MQDKYFKITNHNWNLYLFLSLLVEGGQTGRDSNFGLGYEGKCLLSQDIQAHGTAVGSLLLNELILIIIQKNKKKGFDKLIFYFESSYALNSGGNIKLGDLNPNCTVTK